MHTTWYEPISSFSSLNGWKSPQIAVGDSPNARICRFHFVSKVLHGWPSKDRIIFTNREVFWISSQKIPQAGPAENRKTPDRARDAVPARARARWRPPLSVAVAHGRGQARALLPPLLIMQRS